tara:strand:- start:2802 stop:5546 length:2745 start_codon:yes stop_codon:yes gene_type:complete
MAVAAFTALVQTVVTIAGGTAFGAMAFLGQTGFHAFLAMTATYAVLGAVSRELFAQPSLDTMNGINFNVRDPAATRKIIYGKCRVGGAIVFFNTSDTDNNYLHLVIAVAGHEIESYEQVYFGDRKVWESGSYIDDGTIDWEDHCLLSFHKGDQTAADSTLVDAATGFTSDHKLLGTAYVYVRLDYNAEIYVSGVPNVSFVVKGKKVLDPRSASTAYSNNPALIAYDYLLDTEYGLGESAANIDTASVIASANICDATVTITGATQKAFECDGVLDSGTNIKVNLESILSSMIGSVSYYNGKFSIIAHNHYTAISDAVDTSMIVSPIQVSTKRSRKSQHNTVKGQFISEENDYVVADYPVQKNASYITEDGQEMPLNMTLAMTTNNVRAQRIAKLVMEKSRQQMTISLELNLSGLKYAVGDNIKINYARFSWTNKEFEVTSLQLLPDPERGLIVSIKAVENNASAYAWVAGDAVAFVVAPQVDVYDGTTVIAPTNIKVYADEEDNHVRIVWQGVKESDGADPAEPYFSHYEILAKRQGGQPQQQIRHTDETFITEYEYHWSSRAKVDRNLFFEVRAVNLRGYKSAPLASAVVARNDVFPDIQDNQYKKVFSTIAEPTEDQLTALIIDAGYTLEDGLEISYIRVDGSGAVIDTQDYIYESSLMILNQSTTLQPTSEGADTIAVTNGDFNPPYDGWTVQGNSITFSSLFFNHFLLFTNSGGDHYAYQFIEDTDNEERQLNFKITNMTSGQIVARVMDATTMTQIVIQNFTANGDHSLAFTSTRNYAIVFYGYADDDTNAELDLVTITAPQTDAGQKYTFQIDTESAVTWGVSTSATTGIPSTGVTTPNAGFTGTNLRKPNGNAYVEYSLLRNKANVGFSQQTITVTAEWTESEIIDGQPTTLIKSAERSVILKAEVL